MHTSRDTTAAIDQMECTGLPHPPYYPDLTPSDYHLFRDIKKPLRGCRFAELATVVKAEFQTPFKKGLERLTHRWKKCIQLQGDYVEKVDLTTDV